MIVTTFYKFVSLPDYEDKQAPLLAWCQREGVCGTILLATEGINGTIAGSRPAIDGVLAWLRRDPRLADLEAKDSTTEMPPFDRMKVRLKSEIVTLGLPEIDPSHHTGQPVQPKDWNDLIADPEVVVVDTRNDYEVEIGTFQGAENPHTASFRQFPDYVQKHLDPGRHKKVAMFCTGGIRCEKASAYMLSQGFEEVYQLQGGILKYLAVIPTAESRWRGECFVFDQRVAVQQGLEPGSYELCYGCGHPVSPEAKRLPGYEAGISCPRCVDQLTPDQRSRFEERRHQSELARARGKNAVDWA